MGDQDTRPKARSYRVTSFDVAAEAGVSQSTVSRALAGDPVVSAATRLRVTEAARRLNYFVDENAARLRTGKTGTLAVVVVCRPGEDRKDLNPFHSALLASLCGAASLRGYETLVSFQDGPENFNGRYQEQRKADGLAVIGTTENYSAWDYFRQLGSEGIHWVCWGAPFDDVEWIRSDNHGGGQLATEHLLAQGYKRIVCIGSETSPQRQFLERYEGYARQMRSVGLDPVLMPIEKGLGREEQGRRAVAMLIEQGVPFDALFAVCDPIALGALDELHARGLAVPGKVGVVGFDGIRAGAYASPPLTSIEPDFRTAGEMMVGKLLAEIAGDANENCRVPVQLVVRESSMKGSVA